MKKIEITLYSFSELSKEVQAKVLDKYRCINVEYDSWFSPDIEYHEGELKKAGFEEAKIHFSGFGSQGDGACFDATINLETIIKSCGDEYTPIKSFIENGEITGEIIKLTNHYSHAKTRRLQINDYNSTEINEHAELIARLERHCEKLRVDLCNEIYRDLEKTYYSLMEDEAIIETIEANEYTFEENGKMRNV